MGSGIIASWEEADPDPLPFEHLLVYRSISILPVMP